jgi:predicted Zn finger-like uncharacterized protein
MLIVCPSCASEYTIDPATLGADGRTVRCAVCRDTWFTAPERPEPGSALDTAAPAAVLLRTGSSARRTARRKLRGRAVLGGAALCILVLAWPAAGGASFERVQALAQTMLQGPSPPAFRDVLSEVVGPQGNRTLVVTGEILNGTGEAIDLAPLEFLVRNGDEQVLVTWTSAPPQPSLRPGEAARFEARLPQPPTQGRDVRVHFTKARGVAFAALTDSR